jgi:hypothetical protein
MFLVMIVPLMLMLTAYTPPLKEVISICAGKNGEMSTELLYTLAPAEDVMVMSAWVVCSVLI